MSRLNQINKKRTTDAAAEAVQTPVYNPKFAGDVEFGQAYNAIDGDATIMPANSTQQQKNQTHERIAIAFADVGTSTSTAFTDIQVPNALGNATFTLEVVKGHITTSGTTVRRYMRQWATAVFDHAKTNKFNFAVGVSHGVPQNLGHVGFDFADGIDPTKLSVDEALAIDAAKRSGLFKATAQAVTSTNALYHHGNPAPSTTPGGLLQ